MMVIYGMLIFLCSAGVLNLFLLQNYIRKIFSLAVTYSSFSILMILLFLKNENLNETLMLMFSIFTVFSTNLFVGIGIVKNISEAQKSEN
ncbi:MAG: hypothetical protein KGP29_00195 [Proteobacteria bacterium]|nr:hypothetical protein [Pseudomonadota bacterium]